MIDSPDKSPAQNAQGSVTVQSGEILVDARGHHCPVPTLRLQKALQASPSHAIRLLADDPMARIDVPHFLAAKGYPAAEIASEGSWTVFVIAPRA
jgi:tRNA 2-thiouridine synthesizing protein A